MEIIETKTKKWGNSLGLIIPNEIVKKENLKENIKISFLIIKPIPNPLKEMFGKFKFKKSTDEIMREIDKELYHD